MYNGLHAEVSGVLALAATDVNPIRVLRRRMKLNDIQEIACLSIPEKIVLLEELWDSIAANQDNVPVPESHKAELDKRFARHRDFPGEVLTLEELRRGVESRR